MEVPLSQLRPREKAGRLAGWQAGSGGEEMLVEAHRQRHMNANKSAMHRCCLSRGARGLHDTVQ